MGVGAEQTPGLGKVLKAQMQAKADDQIVQDSHIMTRFANRQAGGIFVESDVSAEVQTSFDAPVLAQQREQFLGISFLGRQAGEAIDDFAGLTLVFGMPDGLSRRKTCAT